MELAIFEINEADIIDGVCDCHRCERFGSDATYVMEGVCRNCHETVYGRFRKGDSTRSLRCDHCGNWSPLSMTWKRLVTK